MRGASQRGRLLYSAKYLRSRRCCECRRRPASFAPMSRVHPYGALTRYWRRKRMQACVDMLGITPETSVLDVGGTMNVWRLSPVRPRLTLLNRFSRPADLPADVKWVEGDALRLPFQDGQFDVVFSNSVIEHLETEANQRTFAAEVQRVGRKYFVQTPDRRFPVEPHLIAPFIHWLPKSWQRVLYPFMPIRLLMPRAELDRAFAELRLLTAKEMRALFPKA